MNQKQKSTANIITNLTILSALSVTIACTSTRKRDERIVQNMEMQNAVIDAEMADRASTEVQAEVLKSDVLKEAEGKLEKTLDALKEANNTVLGKIKPNEKKECASGENQGVDNE